MPISPIHSARNKISSHNLQCNLQCTPPSPPLPAGSLCAICAPAAASARPLSGLLQSRPPPRLQLQHRARAGPDGEASWRAHSRVHSTLLSCCCSMEAPSATSAGKVQQPPTSAWLSARLSAWLSAWLRSAPSPASMTAALPDAASGIRGVLVPADEPCWSSAACGAQVGKAARVGAHSFLQLQRS